MPPPPKSGKNHNNSSHRSYECPPPPGPAQTKFVWVEPGRGVSRKARRGVGLSPKPSAKGGLSRVTPPLSLRRSTINVENVVVRLRQSSAICLRANARSAFLFTGSPRSFHSLAMTKGTKCPSTHHSCHSRARGPRKYECICGVDKAGILYPFSNNSCHSREGGNRVY